MQRHIHSQIEADKIVFNVHFYCIICMFFFLVSFSFILGCVCAFMSCNQSYQKKKKTNKHLRRLHTALTFIYTILTIVFCTHEKCRGFRMCLILLLSFSQLLFVYLNILFFFIFAFITFFVLLFAALYECQCNMNQRFFTSKMDK